MTAPSGMPLVLPCAIKSTCQNPTIETLEGALEGRRRHDVAPLSSGDAQPARAGGANIVANAPHVKTVIAATLEILFIVPPFDVAPAFRIIRHRQSSERNGATRRVRESWGSSWESPGFCRSVTLRDSCGRVQRSRFRSS